MKWFMVKCSTIIGLGIASIACGQAPAAKSPPAKAEVKLETTPETFVETVFTGALHGAEGSNESDSALLKWAKFLGVDLATVDGPLRAHLKLNDGEGFVVMGVNPDGSGAEPGLNVYDVVVGLNGEPKQDAAYPVMVWRQGSKQPLTVRARIAKQFWIGVNLSEIEAAMRAQLSLPEGRGLLVKELTENSPAQQAGLQQFDVIVGWGDGKASGTVEEFSRVIQHSGGKTLAVQILRHAKSMTINVTPIERPTAVATRAAVEYLSWIRTQPLTVSQTPRLVLAQRAVGEWAIAPHVFQWRGAIASNDRQAKLAAVEKHLEQMLKEIQSAREALEQIRKQQEQEKEKPNEEKK
jgi:hypothetical protein